MPQNPRPVEILMVEDNPGDVELTLDGLNDGKLLNTIHVARDGEQALDFIYKRNEFTAAPTPDIILLDLNMPKMSGIEVLEIIKEDPAIKHIPVVVLTSSEADRDVLQSYRLHANCYLVKPVSVEKFLIILQTFEHFWLNVVTLPKSDDDSATSTGSTHG